MSAASQMEAIRSAEPARLATESVGGSNQVWIVGGAIRDALLGVEITDLDLAVETGSEEQVARRIASAAGGFAFELSAEHGTWRVVSAEREWHLDVSGLKAPTIEGDLAARDFTVNAMALDLSQEPADLIDPTGGEADARAGLLKAVSGSTFIDDPLRLLRTARLASEYGLSVDPGTVDLARASGDRVSEPAGERQFAEFRSMIGGSNPLESLELLDRLSLMPGFLPELEELKGVEQGRNHHLDVHGHTLEVLRQLLGIEADLEEVAGENAEEMRAFLDQEISEETTRRTALRFGALFHDMGKPATRQQDGEMVTFMGHDEEGERITRGVCQRLRVGRRLTDHLAALTKTHLRLGFLIHERPLAGERIYAYLRECDPVQADVTLLSVADRLSARGSGSLASEEMVRDHLDLAREMFGPALAWHRDGPPVPPIDGDEVVDLLGIEPGPEVGEVLDELRAATFAGEISDAAGARDLAREIHSRAG